MKKSHVIALCILFVIVSLVVIINAFTLPASKDKFIASRPTGAVKTAPKATTAPEITQEPSSSDAPTEAPSATPQPTPIVRPAVDVSKYAGLSTKSVQWGLESNLEDANDPESRKYTPYGEVLKILDGYDYIYRKTEGAEKPIYLTFNMAFEDGYTAKILDVLRSNNVNAAFFVSADYLKANPETVRTMIEDGHLIASRGDISVKTDGKKGMTATSAQKFCDIMWEMEEEYQAIAGNTSRMKYYRPDEISVRDAELAKAMGYTLVFRSYMCVDWTEKLDYSTMLNKLITNTSSGAVIEMYSTAINGQILQEYITKMKNKGYTFYRLDEN